MDHPLFQVHCKSTKNDAENERCGERHSWGSSEVLDERLCTGCWVRLAEPQEI